MAKKKETVSLIDQLAEFKDQKGIDKSTLINVLEDSFRNVLSKLLGTDENCRVIINAERGDFEIYRDRKIVPDGEVVNEAKEISLTAAQQLDEYAEVGETVTDQIDFNAFGRRAVINLRQALASKVLELQKEDFVNRFRNRIGDLISAEVYQVWKRETLLLDDEGNELLLPKNEQIPGDFFRKGDTVRAVISRVESENNPRVILSRVSGEFLKRLLEQNVPEIADGLITLKAVARIPGERAKIAVESYDDRIDPVGACVGVNGSRIRGVVRELRGENIDVTPFTTNEVLFIQRALSPARLSAVNLTKIIEEVNGEEEEIDLAEVYVKPDQVPLAIGRNASNLKLASILTGYKIEVFRDTDDEQEEDIYLDEFADEIDEWVISQLKTAGLTTARAVLKKTRAELNELVDLEEATLDEVISVLEAEFRDEDVAEDVSPEEAVED